MPPIPPSVAAIAEFLPASAVPTSLPRPLFGSRIPAGFPSPADDYIEEELDVAKLLVRSPSSTYFFRVIGRSMEGHWIRPGDLAVVDTSIQAKVGRVVIAILEGEALIKQYGKDEDDNVLLIPSSKRFKTITVSPEQDFQVWGVVTWTLHRQLA